MSVGQIPECDARRIAWWVAPEKIGSPCNQGGARSGTSRQGPISNESWGFKGIQGSTWKTPCKGVHQA